jgi:glycerol kinase
MTEIEYEWKLGQAFIPDMKEEEREKRYSEWISAVRKSMI